MYICMYVREILLCASVCLFIRYVFVYACRYVDGLQRHMYLLNVSLRLTTHFTTRLYTCVFQVLR
jgi:hypothetical protein